jgi:hypothetical protein
MMLLTPSDKELTDAARDNSDLDPRGGLHRARGSACGVVSFQQIDMKGPVMSDVRRQGRVKSQPVAIGFFQWPDAEFSHPLFRAFGSYPKMLMDYNAEFERFWNDRMNYDRETFRAIAQCAEWPQVIEMEQAWLRDCRKFWGVSAKGGRVGSLTGSGRVAWIVRVVKIGAEGEGPATDVMEINRLGDLADSANLGLTLAETKRLLAGLQQEIVAAQVRDHAARRPAYSRCGGACRVKDYQDHVVAMLFGQVTARLPHFRRAACGGSQSGIAWPPHCRSIPELDWLQAHLSAVMTYRTAADLLEQVFPVDAAKHLRPCAAIP